MAYAISYVLGLEMKFMNKLYPVLIATSNIAEVHVLEKTATGMRIGAATTMAELDTFLKDIIVQDPGK